MEVHINFSSLKLVIKYVWFTEFIKLTFFRAILPRLSYNKQMFLPNAYALEVDTQAANRLKITYPETPKDFVTLGVLIYLVVQ